LAERAETNRVGFNVRDGFETVPRDIFVDGEPRLAVGLNFDGDGAGRRDGINADAVRRKTERSETVENFAAERVVADARNDERVSAERVRVIREVGDRAAELLPRRQQVPEDFADADDFVFHSMPSLCCIASRETPLVSGTMSFTQTSCNTIMPQKNRKT